MSILNYTPPLHEGEKRNLVETYMDTILKVFPLPEENAKFLAFQELDKIEDEHIRFMLSNCLVQIRELMEEKYRYVEAPKGYNLAYRLTAEGIAAKQMKGGHRAYQKKKNTKWYQRLTIYEKITIFFLLLSAIIAIATCIRT